MIRTYSPVARRIPLFTAAPLPLLYGWRTTIAPAPAARAPVSSVEPSSTTMISCHGPAAASADDDLGDRPRASLKAGMTTETSDGIGQRQRSQRRSAPAAVASRAARRRRLVGVAAGQLERAHAVEQILEQLAVGRDHVGEQADQQHLEADDHQDRRRRSATADAGPRSPRSVKIRSRGTATRSATPTKMTVSPM